MGQPDVDGTLQRGGEYATAVRVRIIRLFIHKSAVRRYGYPKYCDHTDGSNRKGRGIHRQICNIVAEHFLGPAAPQHHLAMRQR